MGNTCKGYAYPVHTTHTALSPIEFLHSTVARWSLLALKCGLRRWPTLHTLCFTTAQFTLPTACTHCAQLHTKKCPCEICNFLCSKCTKMCLACRDLQLTALPRWPGWIKGKNKEGGDGQRRRDEAKWRLNPPLRYWVWAVLKASSSLPLNPATGGLGERCKL